MEADGSLAEYLRTAGVSAAAIPRAMRRAEEAGLFVSLSIEADGRTVELYFLNAPADRRGLEAVRAGAVDVGRVVQREPPPKSRTIFTLYEAEIGTVTPAVADELTEAERLYPADWLEAAFREAAAQNARSWRYVSRILERWAAEGPDHAKTERDPGGDRRYLDGRYGRLLKQRLQP
jgi:DnaD/phage-associated family protein